jgi:outer membrane protein, heavy metal efflux system
MKRILAVCLFIWLHRIADGQTMKLTDILDSVGQSFPSLKMYDAEIQSLDAAAKGARNWMAPEISSGFWMTPYNVNLWKNSGSGSTGMGQYMISVEQMFPNQKYNTANEKFMRAMSTVESENKKANLNDLFAETKKNYNEWIIIEKKLLVIDEGDKLLQLMITNAETRYKNGLGKVSAYYKAKAAQGNLAKIRIVLQNDALQKRIILNTLMNRDKLIEFSIDTSYTVSDYENKTFDSSLFYSNRSDIKAIDQSIQLNYLNQQVEIESLKPQFGVQFAHMFGFGGFPEQFTLMGTVKIPFAQWSSRQSKANVESLKWKAVSLETQKQMMANEYSGMAYGMQQEIAARKKQILLFENNIIPALRKNYQSTLLAYEQNTEELFALYDAWETLNSAQLEYFDELQQLLIAQVNLEKILQIK